MRTAAASAGPSEGLLAGRSSGRTKRQADDTTMRPSGSGPTYRTLSQTTCYIRLGDGPGGTLHDYTMFVFNIGQLIELGTRTRLNRTA